MPEEAVLEKPAAAESAAPPGKTSIGDKWRAEMEKIGKSQDTPAAPDKKEEKPATEKTTEKPASALDAALGDIKPEPKPETPEWDTEELPKEPDKQKENWKRARDARKQLQTRLEELEKAPKTDPTLTTRLEELQKTLAERDTTIKALDARYTPEFQSLVKERQNQLGKIATRMKSFGGDGEALVQALHLPEGKVKTDQIKQIMDALEPAHQARIETLLEKLQDHDEKIYDFEKDLPAQYEQISARRQQEESQLFEKQLKDVDTNFENVASKLPVDVVTLREIDPDIPGAKEWNEPIKTAIAKGLSALKPGGADFNESAAIAVKGYHYDTVVKMLLETRQELVAERKRNAEFDKASPDFKAGKKAEGEVKLTPGEKFRKAMDAQSAARDAA